MTYPFIPPYPSFAWRDICPIRFSLTRKESGGYHRLMALSCIFSVHVYESRSGGVVSAQILGHPVDLKIRPFQVRRYNFFATGRYILGARVGRFAKDKRHTPTAYRLECSGKCWVPLASPARTPETIIYAKVDLPSARTGGKILLVLGRIR
jgi:hypothetical protein